MKNRRILAILMTVLLLLSVLTACGAAKESLTGGADNGYASDSAAPEAGLSKGEAMENAPLPTNQKLIRKVYINGETEDMDSLLGQVEQRISELNGYVESRQIYNGSTRYTRSRNAELTIRIPAESLDGFVNQISEASNITSLRETTDDVTLSYVATESRIAALQTEETRLLELMAMAETMEDLLTIEARLTDVRSELEQVKSQLRVYDNQVSYGTVYLSICEVREYTEVEEEPESFFGRIGKGFLESVKNVWNGFLELVVFICTKLPYLLILGAILTGAILVIRHGRKKKKAREETK